MITEDTKLYWTEEREWFFWGAKSYRLPAKRHQGEEYTWTAVPEAKWLEWGRRQQSEPIRLGWDEFRSSYIWWFRDHFYRCKDDLSPGMFAIAFDQKEERRTKRLDKLRREAGE